MTSLTCLAPQVGGLEELGTGWFFLSLCFSLSFILQGLSLSMGPFPIYTSRLFKIIYMMGQGFKRVKTEAALPLDG